MGRRKVHGAEVRAALLDAAERLVETDGVDALSVRAVADATDLPTRAVYSSIGSKSDLVALLADRALDALGRGVDRLPVHDDPIEDLVNIGVNVFRPFALAHPALFRIAFHLTKAADRPGALVADDRLLTPAIDNFVRLLERVARLESADLLGAWSVPGALVAHSALCVGLATLELNTTLIVSGDDTVWRNSLRSLVAGLSTLPPA